MKSFEFEALCSSNPSKRTCVYIPFNLNSRFTKILKWHTDLVKIANSQI